jgi:hypothetical protein
VETHLLDRQRRILLTVGLRREEINRFGYVELMIDAW